MHEQTSSPRKLKSVRVKQKFNFLYDNVRRRNTKKIVRDQSVEIIAQKCFLDNIFRGNYYLLVRTAA